MGNQSNTDFSGSSIATKFSYLFPPLHLLKSILELELFGAQFGFSGGLKKTTEVPVMMSRKGQRDQLTQLIKFKD